MNRTQDTSAVKSVVSNYIKGTAESDPALLRTLFHPTATMSGYLGPDLLTGGPEAFFEAISQNPVGDDYAAEITEISVLGRTARAMVIEDNLYGLSFVNLFHLLKVEDGWTITSKLFHHD